jgi:hypothetical protein
MPDDPHSLLRPRRSERARLACAAELRARSGAVRILSLRDGDLVERLAVAQRNLAEGTAEGTVELEDDHFVDEEAAVALDLNRDVRRGQGERLRGGVPGERERREDRGR